MAQSLVTETGTGSGSRLGNITIRAWITVLVTLTFCLTSLAKVACAILGPLYGIEMSIPDDVVMMNIYTMVITFYFSENRNPKTKQNSNEQTPT